MPRYTSWFRRSLDNRVSGLAKDIGKKMLGRLAHRRDHGGPPTLVERHIMADGTTIEAKFVGGIPQLSIRTPETPEGETLCDLYVESGMLDLGPNIAADATERFDRGLPEFNDDPAMLYFGEDISCADRLNGEIRLAKRKLSSQCLGEFGSGPVESRLTSPTKKQAQAVLPASWWTGLMHRYVAAIYGGDFIDYRLSEDYTLQILDGEDVVADINPYGDPSSWGLVDFGGALRFIEIVNDGSLVMRVYEPVFDPCARLIYLLWKSMPKGTPEQLARADKILTLALSRCRPASEPDQETEIGIIDSNSAILFSWVFKIREPKMANVAWQDEDTTYVHEVTFTLEDGVVSVSFDTLYTGVAVPRITFSRPAKGQLAAQRFDTLSFASTTSADVEAPIYCWYTEDDQLRVVWWYQSDQERLEIDRSGVCGKYEPPIFSLVYASGNPYPTATNTYPWPIVPATGFVFGSLFDPLLSMSLQSVNQPSPMPDDVPCTIGNGLTEVDDADVITRARGMYVKENDVVVWSDINTHTYVDYTEGSVYVAAHSRKRENERDDSCLNSVPFVDIPSPMIKTITPGPAGATYIPTPTFKPYGGSTSTPAECFKYANSSVVETEDRVACCRPDVGPNAYLPGTASSGTLTTETFYHRWEEESVLLLGKSTPLPRTEIIIPWGNRSTAAVLRYQFMGFAGHRSEIRSTYAHMTGYREAVSATVTCERGGVPESCDQEYDEYADVGSPVRSETFQVGGRVIGSPGGCSSPSYAPRNRVVVAHGEETFATSPDLTTAISSTSYTVNVIHNGTPVFADFTESPCYDALGYLLDPPSASDNHLEVQTVYGDKAAYDVAVRGSTQLPNMFTSNFHYRAARSLLGAKITPIVDENFGYSVDMDRETISGGYTKVSWPSFVGWA